ncbi:hypothetical protein EON68_02010 [archaeon]|nr:MAG: hypothetical protein EON68_02010 [archaeon]
MVGEARAAVADAELCAMLATVPPTGESAPRRTAFPPLMASMLSALAIAASMADSDVGEGDTESGDQRRASVGISEPPSGACPLGLQPVVHAPTLPLPPTPLASLSRQNGFELAAVKGCCEFPRGATRATDAGGEQTSPVTLALNALPRTSSLRAPVPPLSSAPAASRAAGGRAGLGCMLRVRYRRLRLDG